MKFAFLIMPWACLLISGCKAQEEKPINDSLEIPVLNKQVTPSSKRSREAILRAGPGLIEDLEQKTLEFGAPVFIRIFKEERQLELWVKGKERYVIFRSYKIAAMSGTLGPKQKEGDRQAVEGFYFVPPGMMNPNSRFHLSFNLGYPNAYDRAHHRTGSALMVHGDRVSIGCFAMTDPKIEEIYTLCDAALRNGQLGFAVHCFPFRMTEANMEKHSASKWIPFWRNLKTGHDWFERMGNPPKVQVKDKRYLFKAD